MITGAVMQKLLNACENDESHDKKNLLITFRKSFSTFAGLNYIKAMS